MKRAPHVSGMREVWKWTTKSLEKWEAYQNKMLVEYTARICNQYLSTSRSDDSEEK